MSPDGRLREPPAGRLARGGAALAGFCAARPWPVLALALLLAIGAAVALAQRFAMDTDVTHLFPPDLPWRQTEQQVAEAFPQREDLIAVVIDAATADAADRAAEALAHRLRAQPALFRTVSRPDALAFFRRNGLLFLSLEELRATTERMIEAQPLLGTLAADPSLRGIATTFGLVLEGVARGDAQLDVLATPLPPLLAAAEAARGGRIAPLDWSALFTGRPPDALALRRFVLAQPMLDFGALSPGEAATAAIRAAIAALPAEPGLRIRLTGQVPMADEEFASVADGAVRNTLLSLALVALVLWLALHSLRLILPVLATLLLGLLLTAAFGTLAIGPFNPLSIAFAVLFIGLGVDFGIQYAVRFREERHLLAGAAGDPARPQEELRSALAAAGGVAGPGIMLAALAVAGGFLAFLPTAYRGASELGAIAGFGLLLAGLLSLTVLPALLRLSAPGGEAGEIGFAALAPLDRLLARWARGVATGALLLGLSTAACLPFVPFDFNPLNLRDPAAESVATFRELMASTDTTPNTLTVLAADQAAAEVVAARLERLPEVARAMTLASFVPEQQDAKLALITDAADLLGPGLAPPEVAAPPDDSAVAQALGTLAAALQREARPDRGGTAALARRFAAVLESLAAPAATAQRQAFAAALLPGLRATLEQLATALQAAPVALADLPAELRQEWIAADGRARVEAYPRDLSDDNAAMVRFAAAVRAVAPQATGMAISVQSSSATIRQAFLVAGIIGLVLSALLLLAALRDLALALIALAPLVLALLLTLATCTLLGPALNLANIIALPLLFGIGIAFDIYYVLEWRSGRRVLLPAALTRAVLFSALTTASAFGSLALSGHPGTASMGVLLALSLVYTLASVLLILPALLHALRPVAPSNTYIKYP